MILIAFALSITYLTKAKEDITGIWLTEEGNSKVEISQNEEDYTGKIAWMVKSTDKNGNTIKDRKNPNKELRDRPILGLAILQNIELQNGKGYGQIYSPKKGLTLDCEVVLVNPDELQINVTYRGFTRQKTWTRTSL